MREGNAQTGVPKRRQYGRLTRAEEAANRRGVKEADHLVPAMPISTDGYFVPDRYLLSPVLRGCERVVFQMADITGETRKARCVKVRVHERELWCHLKTGTLFDPVTGICVGSPQLWLLLPAPGHA